MISKKYKSIAEYHSFCDEKVRAKLDQIYLIIKQIAPNATETISYNMPAFKQSKVLVYYAAFKNHIGFFPTPSPIIAFKNELKMFKTSKGSIRFLLNEPLPVALIKKIVLFRINEDLNNIR